MATPPAVEVVDISDLTAADAGLELLRQDAFPLQSSPLRAKRVLVRLPAATVIYHSTNLRVRARSSVQHPLLAYVAFGPRTGGTVEGLRVRPGLLLVAEPAAQAAFVADPGYESITVFIDPQCLLQRVTAGGRREEFRWPSGVEVLGAVPALAHRLFRLGNRLVTTASSKPTLFDEDCAAREGAQVELLETLLAAMNSADALEPRGNEKTQQAHSRTVAIAEQHALAKSAEQVYVSDLCRAVGVSERTLECAFKEVMGLSPAAYLKRLRLHRVRAALLAADRRSARVSAEALRWGFRHFGEFSGSYKKCFGESPSETLRRRVETPGAADSSPATGTRVARAQHWSSAAKPAPNTGRTALASGPRAPRYSPDAKRGSAS
jgi:AraC family ethanolamine operon transcriptional activator